MGRPEEDFSRLMLLRRSTFLFVVIAGLVGMAIAGADQIDWWTVDGGGEILMVDPSGQSTFEVSGTFGQWDATEAEGAKGGVWEVTGGFWSLSVDQTDYLFSDGFEDE